MTGFQPIASYLSGADGAHVLRSVVSDTSETEPVVVWNLLEGRGAAVGVETSVTTVT